ncbi:two-component sensor histidine kinase [Hylemonella gracilis]|uniref:Signal transduction histidine-protein kinase/phosphatase MprB n=1 Tax=Hylemonella gracilis TaxID=80880 RepID=A0A4P6UR44_9BURK|nr:ATP-binding protein [Hylemonella gracilis]QBK06221.1 two-component sensor histidine kinase [Hylemonella gracilis]
MQLTAVLRLAAFRHWLLAAFILIAVLLGGAAISAVFTLGRLMNEHGEGASRALRLNAATQTLAAHTTAMERAARQSLILNDEPLRQRYAEESQFAEDTLALLLDETAQSRSPDDDMQRLATDPAFEALNGAAQQWRAQLARIRALMARAGTTGDAPASRVLALRHALASERAVARAFRDMDLLTQQLGQRVQQLITRNSEALRERLTRSQRNLGGLVSVAVGLTLALAVGLGLWLARPLRQIERAIVGLGENRLDRPIAIRGPSDVRQLGLQLDWLRLRLMELDADKARFLRHISHELKTPLASLREGVALLEDGVTGPLNERQHEVARILHQNAQTLQQRIEALLRFNAAAFEARQLSRRAVDLHALLAAQIEAQRLQWRGRNLAMRVRHGEDEHREGPSLPAGALPRLPELLLDEEKIGIAIANLLSNAIRFSPPGGVIDLAFGTRLGWVTLDIRDQGPGVAGTDRERIFEPFYRGQRQPEQPSAHALHGSGIGLSIVREYIEAHGGRITLVDDSVSDNASLVPPGAQSPGAHFRIELPHGSPL